MANMNYKKFIEARLRIVDKQGQEVPFLLNKIQDKYLTTDKTGRDVILKARQQGFSSLILASFTADFLLQKNSRSVVVADIDDNSSELLDRVKRYIRFYEEFTHTQVPLRYNSKTELYNTAMDSRYTIGTAKNTEFGRSKTITNLHLSEAAFYPNLQKIMAGAGQAVVENGNFTIETTANGFNEFKTFWEECKRGERPFKPLFYKASDFYTQEFLDKKKLELKELFKQEYPETDIEAFLTSGEQYFNPEALMWYMENVKKPLTEGVIYV
jgi:hypothetical protein